MTRRPAVIAATVVGLAAAAGMVLVVLGLGPVEAGRAVIGAAFVLVIPGAAICAAAFRPGSLRVEELAVTSVGLSVGATILLGFAFEALGIRISAGPCLASLGGISLLGGAIGVRRRRAAPEAAAAPPGRRFPSALQLGAVGLACLLATAALVVARGAAVAQVHPGFSALSMSADEAGSVQLSVSNGEGAVTSYRVVLEAGGATVANWQTGTVEPGGTWTAEATLPAGTTSATASLYRADDPGTVYRRVAWDAAAGP